MEPEDAAAQIRTFCESHADPALVHKYEKYFVEGYDAYGVDGKLTLEQRKLWLESWSGHHDLDWFLDLGDCLVRTGKYEEGWLAIAFILMQLKKVTPEVFPRVGAWLDEGGLRNWAHTDTISGDLLAEFLKRKLVPLSAFEPWRSAPSKWKRRAVPVTLIKALKLDYSTRELLDFIDPMMNDPEKVVHQGLGWFLRETWKRDPQPVEALLLKWKDTCARLIVQYATEKMTKDEKARFKKEK